MLLSNVVSILADMFNTSAKKQFDNLNNQIDKKQLSKEKEKRLAHGLKDMPSSENNNTDYEQELPIDLIM